MAKRGKFGARVFLVDTSRIQVIQTIKRGDAYTARYIIDLKPNRRGRRKFVDITDDKSIADAIRAALHGGL